jgi:hypothetical protein
MLLAVAGLCGCSDSNLIGRLGQEPRLPNKLALAGVLCTDDPVTRRFPVKIMFVVDSSSTMREAAPSGEHVAAVQDIINNNLPIPNVEVAIIRYDDRPESLIQVPLDLGSTGFSRDDALVDAALTQLRNGAGGRDTESAFSLARSIITGDAFQAERGTLARTKYVMVHVTSGSPAPAILPERCEDRVDLADEVCEVAILEEIVREIRDTVLDQGAAEFNFHTAFVQPAIVEGAPCDPMTPACPGGLACVQIGGNRLTGRCIEPCVDDTQCVLDPIRNTCATLDLGDGTQLDYCARDELACFDGIDNDGDGQDRDCSDPTYPYDCRGENGCEEACRSSCRTDQLGVRLSLVTAGQTLRFRTADEISLGDIDFRSTQERFVLKEFIVSNRNAIPTENGLVVDSDGDGLSDVEEDELGLDALAIDTDGDFYNDRLEQLFKPLGFDPLVIDTVPTCVDPSIDRDGDGLNDCEEDLLSTDPTLFDSDADGFPDFLEFQAGTNATFRDGLDDIDLDGQTNGQEILNHTDALSNDGRVRAELAYRYRTLDLGPTGDRRQCYDVRISNITLLETRDQGFGPGFNNVDVFFGQVPQNDREGLALFKATTIRLQYIEPDFRDPDTPILELREEDFIFVEP